MDITTVREGLRWRNDGELTHQGTRVLERLAAVSRILSCTFFHRSRTHHVVRRSFHCITLCCPNDGQFFHCSATAVCCAAIRSFGTCQPRTCLPTHSWHLIICLFVQTFLDAGEVTDRVLTVVKNFDKVDASKVTAESKFSEDLGLDSLDSVEVVMAIEDEFAVEIPDAEADKIASINDAVEYITGHPMAK